MPDELNARFDENDIALQLLTLPAATPRAAARLLARQHLQSWLTQLRVEPGLALHENCNGPTLPGSNLHISLSYAGNKVLMGLCRGRKLGVDLVEIADIPERAALAQLYFPSSWHARAVSLPDFASVWAELEACCKALNLPLSEISTAREQAYESCQLFDFKQINNYRLAVATANAPGDEPAQSGAFQNGI